MKNLFKRLGTQIILIAVAALAITVTVVLSFALIMFGGYNDSILVERANVGRKLLENTVAEKTQEMINCYDSWSGQSSFIGGMTFGKADYFENAFKEFAKDDGYFCEVGYLNGTVIYKTDNFPFKNFDIASAAKGSSLKGVYQAEDALTVICSGKVEANGVVCGLVVGFDLRSAAWLDSLKKIIDCDVSIFSGSTRYSTTIVDPSTGNRVIGTDMADNIKSKVIGSGENYSGKAEITGKPYYVSYAPMTDLKNNTVGSYFAGSDASEASSRFSSVILVAVVIAVVALLITGVSVFMFTRRKVITPINHATMLADEMERGQLSTTSVDYVFSDNEVGKFAEKLRHTKKELSGCINDISDIMDHMAAGDFTVAPNVVYPGDFEAIERNIAKIETDLGSTLTQMGMSSDEVLSGSDQMADGSQSLADGTTKQAAAIQEISNTISDITAKISSTARNAADAGEISRQTADEVSRQDSSITNMVAAMDEISSTSREIEKIIKTIEDISFQTNILALNAAVEAARAGDAGKGFAVVADEVRNLANKSAEAAKSTTDLINASISAVEKGSRIAGETAESMKQVKEKTAQTNELILMIADASAEQTDSINQINSGIEQISQVIQLNSATAEETAASCQELSGQSRLLKDQVARFKVK